MVDRPLAERRHALEEFAERHLATTANAALWLSPVTTELNAVERWLDSLGAGLDGIIAKRKDLPYRPGDRTAMQKYKKMRTADCVVGGFRYTSRARVVGSLLLGLYDDAHLLHHVGFAANLPAADRPALTAKLEALVKPPGFTGQRPGGPSRWSSERSGDWKPLATHLVVEVQYDHFSAGRFRHGTKLLRWRPDKAPQQCTMQQVVQEAAATMRLLKPARAASAQRGRRTSHAHA